MQQDEPLRFEPEVQDILNRLKSRLGLLVQAMDLITEALETPCPNTQDDELRHAIDKHVKLTKTELNRQFAELLYMDRNTTELILDELKTIQFRTRQNSNLPNEHDALLEQIHDSITELISRIDN